MANQPEPSRTHQTIELDSETSTKAIEPPCAMVHIQSRRRRDKNRRQERIETIQAELICRIPALITTAIFK